MAVWKPGGARRGRGRVRGWRARVGRSRGRNGSRFVVLRAQGAVVDLRLRVVRFGRTFDVHERHRARHLDLARLLLGCPWQ